MMQEALTALTEITAHCVENKAAVGAMSGKHGTAWSGVRFESHGAVAQGGSPPGCSQYTQNTEPSTCPWESPSPILVAPLRVVSVDVCR